MPKIKTHSSVKGRFKITGTGKIKFTRAKRRHMMSNKTKKMKRQARPAGVLCAADTRIVMRNMMRNG